MKKTLSLILVLLIAFSAAACAGGSSEKNEADSNNIPVTDDANTGENIDSPTNDGQDSVASQLVGTWLQYKYSPLEVDEEMRFFPDGSLEYVRYEESTPGTYTISQSSQGDTLFFEECRRQDPITFEMRTDRYFSVLTNEIDLTTDHETKEALYRKYEDRYGNGDGEYSYAGVLAISDGILYNGHEVWVKSDRVDRDTPVSLNGVWFRYDGSYYVFDSDGTGRSCKPHEGSDEIVPFIYEYDEQRHQLVLYREGGKEYEPKLNPYTITGNTMESNCDSCWFKK